MTRVPKASIHTINRAYEDLVQAYTGAPGFGRVPALRYTDTLNTDPLAVAAHFAALAGTTLGALDEEQR